MILGYLLWAYVFWVAVVALRREWELETYAGGPGGRGRENLGRIPGDW